MRIIKNTTYIHLIIAIAVILAMEKTNGYKISQP